MRRSSSTSRRAPAVARRGSSAKSLDLIPGNLQWAENGKALLLRHGREGRAARVSRGRRRPAPSRRSTTGPRGVRASNISPTLGTMVYLANDFQHLDDVYSASLDGKSERKLTDVNAALWKTLDLAASSA